MKKSKITEIKMKYFSFLTINCIQLDKSKKICSSPNEIRKNQIIEVLGK